VTETGTRGLAGVPLLFKASVSALTLAGGFRALSDDDYARIVIAERFAASPTLDPSGTSWLPFPFWLTGTVMAGLGPSVATARAVAFVLGVLAIGLVWLSARLLGASRRGALGGACLAAVFPYSAWTGVATVPELPTAALILFGAASLVRQGNARIWGGLALAAACLSRYEAWPVAALFALFSSTEALRARFSRPGNRPAVASALGGRPAVASALGAGIALAAPLAWLAHGALHHGSALFFVQRVSDYRRAIGAGSSNFSDALWSFPSMLVRCEPELVAIATLSACAAIATGAKTLARHGRVALALALLLGFLIAGEWRDGAPTHHAERALMAIWLWLCVLAGDAASDAWAAFSSERRALFIALSGLALAPAAGIVRPWYARRDGFVDRAAEVQIGEAIRASASATERVLIDSPDYGFHAIMAGFGAPDRAEPIDDHDPRKPKPPDAFSSREALQERVARSGAQWLVVTAEHAPLAAHLGHLTAQNRSLSLYRIEPRAAAPH
jgi:hypothetical protein